METSPTVILATMVGTGTVGVFLVATSRTSLPRRRLGAGGILAALACASLIPRMPLVSGSPVHAGIPAETVVTVTARALHDLRPGASGWMHLSIEPEQVQNRAGWSASAGGRITLLWEGSGYLMDDGGSTALPVRGDGVVVTGLAGIPDGRDSLLVVSREDLLVERRGGATEVRRRVRTILRRRLGRLPRGSRGLGEALLLGDRGDVPREFAEAMRRAGASHVLALSGMHLAILAGLLTASLRPILPARVRRVTILPVLTGYVWIVGAIPSLLRALVLFAFAAFARTRDRTVPSPILLARTVLAVVVLAPSLVPELGFVLSVLALAGLLLWTEPIAEVLSRVLPRPVALPIAAGAAAILGTGALSLTVFGEVYPAGLLMAGVLSLGIVVAMWNLLLVVALARVPLLGTFVLVTFDRIARAMAALAGAGARIPAARGIAAVAVLVLIALPVLPSPRRIGPPVHEPRFDF